MTTTFYRLFSVFSHPKYIPLTHLYPYRYVISYKQLMSRLNNKGEIEYDMGSTA